MEVRETAACGVSEREFSIDLNETEIEKLYKVIKKAVEGDGEIDAQFAEELMTNMKFIVGPSIEG